MKRGQKPSFLFNTLQSSGLNYGLSLVLIPPERQTQATPSTILECGWGILSTALIAPRTICLEQLFQHFE